MTMMKLIQFDYFSDLECDSSVSWSHFVSSCLRAESQQGPYRGWEEDLVSSVYLDCPRETCGKIEKYKKSQDFS